MNIFFAPLQGHTDSTFRNAFEKIFIGIDKYYSPFIRMHKGEVRKKDIYDINLDNDTTGKLTPQFIAGSGQEAQPLLKMIEDFGHKSADFNIGCPFPMITKAKKGSGILPHPAQVEDVLNMITKNDNLSISVKSRLGFSNNDELYKLLPLIEQHPIKQLAVHARIGTQQYKGEVDIDAFKKIYDNTSIPLVYNGDICSLSDYENIVNQFPNLSGIMIGRGLLQDPFLAEEIKEGKTISSNDKIARLKEFHDYLYESYAERLEGNGHLLNKMKTVWTYLLPNGERKPKKQIAKTSSIAKYNVAVNQLLSKQ